MTKALTVTSNRHIHAVGYYLFMAGMGLLFTLSPEPIRYLVTQNGEAAARGWALLLIAGGTYSLVSMFYKDAEQYLKMECVSSLVIGLMMAWVWTAVSMSGNAQPFGTLLMGYFVFAGIGRSVQTGFELLKVKRARAKPVISNEEYLADTENQTK